jgi:6-phosphogluconate dehydrogenase
VEEHAMSEMAIGMVGLGVMGRNLALNIEENGFSVAAYDAWPEPVDKFLAAAQGRNVAGFKSVEEFVKNLRRPRRIILLVKAGEIVDQTIASLKPFLEAGDVIVDGGNEYFKNTERRAKELEASGIRYFGMGVSGGELGARQGPSLMPGGDKAAYDELAPILTKIAAKHDDGPCVTYVGPGGAGHYAKMVHNGIEYGLMQLIAEAYSILKQQAGLSNPQLAETFDEWNQGELKSYLIEISAEIFRKVDPFEPDAFLVDMILDAASMKGTGKWTVQEAAELGSPASTISAALDARSASARRSIRVDAMGTLPGPFVSPISARVMDRKRLVNNIKTALYASQIVCYAQGMALLSAASESYGWDLQLDELARIWQAGCIIRASLLTKIRAAYQEKAKLSHLLLSPTFIDEMENLQDGWRRVVVESFNTGIPLIGMSTSLSYYDMIRCDRLPTNLIQAQRDFFGAHGYKRIDREGDFHTDWTELV